MSRIIIASANENARLQVSRALTASGFSIFRCCASESEFRRSMSVCDHVLLLMAGLLPDTAPEELLSDFRHRLQILLIARPPVIAEHTAQGLFHLSYPCSGNALVGAVEMLIQMQAMNHPQRSAPDRMLVEKAKQFLILQTGMTEPEAHQHMQHYAMAHGMKMTDYARHLLSGACNPPGKS